MRNPFFFGVGGVVSADIAVPQHDRELAFYSAILTTGNPPLWRDDLTNNRGTSIIGLGPQSPEYGTLPLQWMPHFQVADVATSASTTRALGGRELLHGKTAAGESQWAVLSDPNGATFGIIPQLSRPRDVDRSSEPTGRISWLSLKVPETSPIEHFYRKVVGWQSTPLNPDTTNLAHQDFEMRVDESGAAAEILSAGDDQTIPPVWLIHLPVADITESLQLVQKYGGQVVQQSATRTKAVVRDPIGVYLALINI